MAYFELTVIKADLDITSTDFDVTVGTNQLPDWGLKADSEVDDLLYLSAEKARRILSLPVLPLTTVPESIKDASNHLVRAKYYEFTKNIERATAMQNEAQRLIDNYILRLKTDQRVYGRVAR